MTTLYLDVYFLINFTVDTLAVFFALKLCRLKASIGAITTSGIIGAVVSCISVIFDPAFIIFAPLLLLSAWLIVFTTARNEAWHRKIRLLLSILLFEALIGGVVGWLYGLLDKSILPLINQADGGAENKKMLLLSMLILLSIGIVKLFLRIFMSSQQCRTASVSIALSDQTANVDGFFDSGNMLTDPLSGRSVIIVKYHAIENLLSKYGGELAFTEPTEDIKKRMRVLPTKNVGNDCILYGLLPDTVLIKLGKKTMRADVVIAVDFTKGNFGGFDAIIPASVK